MKKKHDLGDKLEWFLEGNLTDVNDYGKRKNLKYIS